MGFQLERKITVGTLLNALLMLSIVISGFMYIRNDVESVKKQQELHEDFRKEVRSNYVNREQLDYMVIHRINRMERNLNDKLDQIHTKILNDRAND